MDSLKNADTNGKVRERLIKSSLNKLFDERERRAHPEKDDKVLVDWNGLMIAAFASWYMIYLNVGH